MPARPPARECVFDGFVRRRDQGADATIRVDVDAALGRGSIAALWGEGRPLAGAVGRGGVAVLEIADRRLVARELRRGGLLRAVLPDAFFDADRARRELEVLARLAAAGVAAVPPVAALSRPHWRWTQRWWNPGRWSETARPRGLLFRQRLITELVPDALPLPSFVAQRPDRRRATVEAAGRLIGAAFAAGLRHPDLHPENVLARQDGGRVATLLVDLDRARLAGPVSVTDRDAMLVRMARFCAKHRERLSASPSRADQLRFLIATGLTRAAARDAMARLAQRLDRQLAWRRYASLWSSTRWKSSGPARYTAAQ